jgi:polyhydroxybutyrate depolymerase
MRRFLRIVLGGFVVIAALGGALFGYFLCTPVADTPRTAGTRTAGGVDVERLLWRNGSGVEVELVAVHGGGHGMPQPYWRRPRILGPSPSEPNGPAVIWSFFERQTKPEAPR